MRDSTVLSSMVLVVPLALVCVLAGPASGQPQTAWDPPKLADGQPDINGMWNNVGAAHTPLELPDQFKGREPTQEEIAALIQQRSDSRKAAEWTGFENSRGVGAYANYWFDWFWKEPVVDAPALVVHPRDGQVPATTPEAQESVAYYREHLHDSYNTIESGDRCLSRGVFGMMMPTAYNNGTLIVQSPDHIVLHSEMIHNARVIPIDAGPHVDDKITQWEGNPRGHWEGQHTGRRVDQLQGCRQHEGARVESTAA